MYELIRKNISRFINLTEDEFEIFTSLLKHRKLKRKQYLLQAGDICRYESFVIKGCLRTFSVDDKGQEHVLQFAIEDWWTGDLHSFFTETASYYNIEALEETEVLQIDNDSLEKLYVTVPKFERFFRILMQKSLITFQKRVMNTIKEKAEDRYVEFINKYPQLEQRIPQHQLASYLGITPESLSRIRKQLSVRKS
ncbi:MAG: Crp/Fnr family transcriptional regulator [Ferruginibacter sp.]